MVRRMRTTVVNAALCVAIASTIPFSTYALNVEQCSEASDIMWPHESEGDYKDFGNSLIAYQSGGCLDFGCWTHVNFVNCRSGEALEIDAKNTTRSDVALNIVGRAVESSERYQFADVKRLLSEAGFESDLAVSDNEICACKALYPKDRRGKAPYVFESMFKAEPANDAMQ